jgi:hypothetical protein
VLSSQNTAANVTPDVLVLTRIGSGTVTGDNGINFGNNCVEFGLAGSPVTLTAISGDQVFSGWTGACTGTALTCTVVLAADTSITANFAPAPTGGGGSGGGGVDGNYFLSHCEAQREWRRLGVAAAPGPDLTRWRVSPKRPESSTISYRPLLCGNRAECRSVR